MPRPITPETCLATRYPELAEQWVRAVRCDKGPNDVRPHARTLVLWQCPDHPHHQWEGRVTSRVPKKPGDAISKCPYCTGHRVLPERSIAVLQRALAKEYCAELNGDRPATSVGPGSGPVWWKCEHGHVWKRAVYDRVRSPHSTCPECRSISFTHSKLLEEWDVQANERAGLDPKRLTHGSGKRAHWVCRDCRHRWTAVVKARTGGRGECPDCRRNRAQAARASSSPKRKVGRPVETTLVQACEELGLSEILAAAWVEAVGPAAGSKLEEVGAQSHIPARWRCSACGGFFERKVANWLNRQPALCRPCSDAKKALDRRLPPLGTLARSEDAARIMLAQWDASANRPLGLLAEEIPVTLGRAVGWLCGACGHRWQGAPKHRRAAIRQRLFDIERGVSVAEPDNEFACPRCCAAPGSSAVEIALGLELQCFFPSLRLGFLDGVKVQLPGKRPYKPDYVLPEAKVFIEYDGHGYHRDKAESDRRRALEVASSCGFRVLRVRERSSGDVPLPSLEGVWCIEVGQRDTVVSKTAQVVRALEEAGVHPSAAGAPSLQVYLGDHRWLTQQQAVEHRRTLGARKRKRAERGGALPQGERPGEAQEQAFLFITDRLVELTPHQLMDLYDRFGHVWKRVGEHLGFQTQSGLTGAIHSVYGCTPTQLAERYGRAVAQPSRSQRVLTSGDYDHHLGQLSDAEIGRMAGCSKQSVAARRQDLGIPPAPRPPHPLVAFEALLGVLADSAVARRAGCSKSAVGKYRRRLGIAPAPRGRKS